MAFTFWNARKVRVWLFNYAKVNGVKPSNFTKTVAKIWAQVINHACQCKQSRQNEKRKYTRLYLEALLCPEASSPSFLSLFFNIIVSTRLSMIFNPGIKLSKVESWEVIPWCRFDRVLKGLENVLDLWRVNKNREINVLLKKYILRAKQPDIKW